MHEAKLNSFRSYKGARKENGPAFNVQWKESEKDHIWSMVTFTKEKGKWKVADNVYSADDGN